LFIIVIVLHFSLFGLIFFSENEITSNNKQDTYPTNETIPHLATDEPNGRLLQIHQYANITSSTYSNIRSGENVSYTLTQGWVSKNTTVNYEGVSKKEQIVVNSDLDSDDSGWVYKTNTGDLTNSWDGTGGHPNGYISIQSSGNNARLKGEYAYFEQNITLQNEALRSDTATFSFDYRKEWSNTFNASLFMSIIIGDTEINQSVYASSLPLTTWFSTIMNYNPVSYGQVLPGVITIRVGFIMNEDASKNWCKFNFDNFKFELWTELNETGLIKTYDNEFAQNYTYYNKLETIGSGYSYIETDRVRNPTEDVDFTIYSNISGFLDFIVDTITLTSYAMKVINSTASGKIGSLYTLGSNISWQVEFSISSIPGGYSSWVEFDKPSDWSFTQILDGFEANVTGSCLGRYFGSQRLTIPYWVFGSGIWKLEAISKNYISNGNLQVWNGSSFRSTEKLKFNDIFQIEVSLNNSVSLPNTRLNVTIFYPNSSIAWQDSREPSSYNEIFGNFTIGPGMVVGQYTATIQWVNNQSYLEIDKVGFKELEFIVWHHSNLTAETSFFEIITGDPLLVKVRLTDADINSPIAFAEVMYNSTFGQSGTMLYQGSGIYLADIDTSSLGLGDYFISVNSISDFYENQSVNNLIHIKVISQALQLEVPHNVIEAMANSFATCQINVTGAISGAMIWPANISTDWQRSWDTINHNNGSYTLNFSTANLPTEGIIDTFTIAIQANKTNYGATIGYVTMSITPISTIINVNSSVVNPSVNTAIDIKINFTEEESGQLVAGANLTVTWSSVFNVTPDGNGFILRLDTVNLSIDTYTAVLQLEKEGFEAAFKTITVNVVHIEMEVGPIDFQDSLDVFIGETITIRINLTEAGTDNYIDNASVWFSWIFGNGYFSYVSDGIYELELEIPSIVGSRTMELIITKEGSLYKSTDFSFVISITDPLPSTSSGLPWYILLALIGVIAVLGVISLRSYVIIPAKRRKRATLLATTQRYKDIMNIEAIVVSGKESGINIYSKSYYVFKSYQNELLSGFIQAITLISREIIGREKMEQVTIKSDPLKSKEKIIELDFKHFNFFISDYKELRIVFILKEKASERFKEKTAEFLSKINSHVSHKIEKWDGDLEIFNKILPPLIQDHFQLYYREEYRINPTIDPNLISKETALSKMEKRVLNVIFSMTREQKNFYLRDTTETVHEKDQDKIIEALEMLIKKQIVISSTTGVKTSLK
jgi:hypothetical protein